jgi:hypothetical protein
MALINLKLVARDWKIILLTAFLVTIFLFLGGAFEKDEQNISIFLAVLFGAFIAVCVFWSAGFAIYELVVACRLSSRLKKQLKDKKDFHE